MRVLLVIESGEICRIGRSHRLLCLCQLILKLLQLLLLLLRAACIVGGIDVVGDELLELGDSEISLTVKRAVIEDSYLRIGVLTATGRNTDSLRIGIDDVEIVPALFVDAVVVLVDIVGIISVAAEFVAILLDVLIECLFLLGVETGIWPAKRILGLASGICSAAACKVLTLIEIAVRVSPDVR